jgi:hypothetical protein
MSPPSGLSFLKIIAALLLSSGFVHAQWLVYDLRFQVDQETSVNFGPYSGAYLIAPIEGGTASMIFVTEEGGRFYTVAANSARYFVATNMAKRRAVVSASTQTGTAQVMYQASGALNSTMAYTVAGERRGARIPLDLAGMMMASDDEKEAMVPGVDASIGMVGTATMKGSLRVDLSRIVNESEMPMSNAIAALSTLLEKYGYQTEDAATAQPVAPAPAPIPQQPVAGQPDNSLFPVGSREEMERVQQ